LSLDKGPRERELISRLLTCLHPNPLEDSDVVKGFEILMDSLDDLAIDIPDAKVSKRQVTPLFFLFQST
jgi:programmed cell death protein 4